MDARLLAAVAVLLIGGIVATQFISPPENDTTAPTDAATAAYEPTVPVDPVPLKPIDAGDGLVNEHGERFALSNVSGQAVLLFFGYANCPDICPVVMDKMAAATDAVGADTLTPIMITVDPARDTPAALDRYVNRFHEDIIGVTGAQEDLWPVLERYQVAPTVSFTQDGEPVNYSVLGANDSYDVNHYGLVTGASPDHIERLALTPSMPESEWIAAAHYLLSNRTAEAGGSLNRSEHIHRHDDGSAHLHE